MILKFRHRGLKRLYETGDRRRISRDGAARVGGILTLLDVARDLGDMAVPGYRPHPLKGDRKEFWRIDVTGDWRITFRFERGDGCDVNFEDYHQEV